MFYPRCKCFDHNSAGYALSVSINYFSYSPKDFEEFLGNIIFTKRVFKCEVKLVVLIQHGKTNLVGTWFLATFAIYVYWDVFLQATDQTRTTEINIDLKERKSSYVYSIIIRGLVS